MKAVVILAAASVVAAQAVDLSGLPECSVRCQFLPY